MKKLTINDIAKLANVSKGTVSKVLNNYPHVSDEMRERVMKIVRETGFERHHVAQILASARSNIVGLIIPSGAKSVFADPYFPHLTECITRACNTHGLTVSLLLYYAEQENISATKNILSNGLLDGVILSGDRKDNQMLPLLMRTNIPFVFLGRPMNGERVHFVDVDNFGGGKQATEYLLSRGYQRIGIITSDLNWACEHRYAGYVAALGDLYHPQRVAYGDFTPESAYHAMKHLLDADVDALFVVSDTMALGALQCIREHGLRVPEDIAVVGFDDLPLSHQSHPPLTTIRQPIDEQARTAVTILAQLIEAPDDHQQRRVILPTQLVIRGSTR